MLPVLMSPTDTYGVFTATLHCPQSTIEVNLLDSCSQCSVAVKTSQARIQGGAPAPSRISGRKSKLHTLKHYKL